MSAPSGTPLRDAPLLTREWLLDHQQELLELMPHEWTLGHNWNQYPLLYRIERNGVPLHNQEMYVQVMRELYSLGLIERDESNPAGTMVRRGKTIEDAPDPDRNEYMPIMLAVVFLVIALVGFNFGSDPSYHIVIRIPAAMLAAVSIGFCACFAGQAIKEIAVK